MTDQNKEFTDAETRELARALCEVLKARRPQPLLAICALAKVMVSLARLAGVDEGDARMIVDIYIEREKIDHPRP